MEFEVDDGLYDRLVNKHKDLPDSIIENLANNQSRNNYIISDYLKNKKEYEKTIIFADRWFQCEYFVKKLTEQGVRAGAVYSVVTKQDYAYQSGSGRSNNNEENRKVMEDFRNDKYDVIVNVKMLTEGVDVPDVKTVMITRQTTSSILMTQMIGRALRGEKAGGGKNKSHANIVFFNDTWRRLLPWVSPTGELGTERPPKQGKNPMSLISVNLIRLATNDIEYKGFADANYITFIPVGFYNCEYTIAIEDSGTEELVSCEENIIVYEFNQKKYDELIESLSTQNLTQYANESINESLVEEKSKELADEFFDVDKDDFDGLLIENITKIIQHIAQNNNNPLFVDFHERDIYDLDKLAEGLLHTNTLDKDIILSNNFNNEALYWNFFYKTYDYFIDAYYKAEKRVLFIKRGESLPRNRKSTSKKGDELTNEVKQQVLSRDNYTCLCCGKKKSRSTPINVDHIRPVSMGGSNAISNLQTLCKQCNNLKGVNEINYQVNTTPLRKPKAELELIDWQTNDSYDNTIARIVNTFYHCRAMHTLNWHQRSNGKYYTTWEIILYSDNNPAWLKAHVKELRKFINDNLVEYNQVFKIVVKN